MAAHLYIGIDSGGTATRALLADRTGRIHGVGHAGSANRNHYTQDQVRGNLREAIVMARGDHPMSGASLTVFLGMSGVSIESDRREIAEIVREIPEVGPDAGVVVDNDTVAGLTGGLSGRPGIALIAGTGSACLGVNAHGERWLCGGWGALADDVGSAPWVGLRALQAAARAEDGRRGPTTLRNIVFDFLGLAEPRQLISRLHNQGLERADLGRLAPLVVEACENGDAAAAMILREAAVQLSALASVTARRLFGSAPCEMILVGGFALSGPPFQAMLTDRIHQDTPNLHVVVPELSPVQGAVLEALRADGVPWTPSVLANLATL
jgi:glucosamine kinase